MSISNYGENFMLDALPDTVYLKLHTGDPGEDATSNPAANTARESVDLDAASSGARATSTEALWTNVPNAETYSHVSVWDASTAGNPLWSGALGTPKTVGVGDDFKIAVAALALGLN